MNENIPLKPVEVAGSLESAGASANPAWIQFAIMGGVLLFMWLFVMRPNAQKQKEHKKFLDDLKSGSEIITTSGIIGIVKKIENDVVYLDLGQNTVRVQKSSISSLWQSSKTA